MQRKSVTEQIKDENALKHAEHSSQNGNNKFFPISNYLKC